MKFNSLGKNNEIFHSITIVTNQYHSLIRSLCYNNYNLIRSVFDYNPIIQT